MLKLVVICAFATLVASKPSTLISSGTSSSVTTEEKTEIRHHVPLTGVHLESVPALRTTEILTPTAEIVQPAAVSHQFRNEIHRPIVKTTEFIAPATKIVQPYLNIVPEAVSHQFRSDIHRSPVLKTAEIVTPIKTEIIENKPTIEIKSVENPLLKTTRIIGQPIAEAHIIGSAPVIQKTQILEHAPLLKKSEISHSYVETTKSDYLGAPHAVVGYSPFSKVAIAPYARLGAEPLLIPSLGATEYLVHQPLRYL